MSHNHAVLEKAGARILSAAAGYSELIRRLLPHRPVIAVISRSPGNWCEEIAAEAATTANRVVVVPVAALRQISDPMPATADFWPGPTENVWFWPSRSKPPVPARRGLRLPVSEVWLAGLREYFDTILLDCSALWPGPNGAPIARLADAAVLAVEEGTRTRQARRDVAGLRKSGVKVEGTIFVAKRRSDAT
jgi:hypothetical protein